MICPTNTTINVSPTVYVNETFMNETFKEFIKWGSGFTIDAERDYKTKGEPLIYHLFMFGLHYPDKYEIVGRDLEKLMKQAIRDGKKRYIHRPVHCV